MNTEAQKLIIESIVNDFCDLITGDSKKEFYHLSDKEFIMSGILGSIDDFVGFGENGSNQKKISRDMPSISNDVIIEKDSNARVFVKIKGFVFYQSCLDYMSIREYTAKKLKNLLQLSSDDIESILETAIKANQVFDLRLPSVFKKVNLDSVCDEIIIDCHQLEHGFEANYSEKLTGQVKNHFINKINDSFFHGLNVRYSLHDISTKKRYDDFINTYKIEASSNWIINCKMVISEYNEQSWRLSVLYSNKSKKLNTENFNDPRIYNAILEIYSDTSNIFQDFPLEYLKKNYKSKPKVKSISNNTASYYEDGTIKTTNIPKYIQNRLVPKNNYFEQCKFENLISNPVDSLDTILKGLEADYLLAEERYLYYCSNKENENKNLFERDLKDYRQEINRFMSGIEMIKRKHSVFKAFELMNKTFLLNTTDTQKSYIGWRLFQIVFIVSLIPDIIYSEYINENDVLQKYTDSSITDLLYFPTGGGKTEAFFGCVVFALFFDRLRGKNFGVTSIIKYPLRLLSAQQLERALFIIVKANEIKSTDKDMKSLPDFSLGYFVGEGNTANDIKTNDLESLINMSQSDLDEKHKIIDNCPLCNKREIHVNFNKKTWHMEHVCSNVECNMDILPLFTIDTEIYRNLPSVIVSTIDKLANIGLNANYKALFGGSKTRCNSHGFHIHNKCSINNCNDVLTPAHEILKDPLPTLMIQDELHLVRESLGVFASHYETFLNYYCQNLVNLKYRKKLKYIGATATIVNYEDHIYNLYSTISRRFPCQYPNLNNDEDFYSKIDYENISRIILGFSPSGNSITEAIMETNIALRRIIYNLIINPSANFAKIAEVDKNVTLDEYTEYLKNYWISINYTNSKDDAIELNNIYQNQGNNKLSNENIPPFIIEQMVGDTDFQDIRQVMSDIEDSNDLFNTKNLILATSTISHGVDEDKFNQMYFYGLPNNTAEYIQAYSRVGRKYPGFIVDIIRMMRERDKSYLKNFKIFHENKDLLIDPVPINRWAKNSIYLTLPGLLSATIKQYIEPNNTYGSMHFARNFKKYLDNNPDSISQIINILIEAYKCTESVPQSMLFKEIIELEISSILNGMKNDSSIGNETTLFNMIEKYSSKNLGPMRSLRDVEKGLLIRVN